MWPPLPISKRASLVSARDLLSSVPSSKFADIFRAGHPGWLRCSPLKYSRYSRASRLAIRAPRSGKFVTEFRTRDTSNKCVPASRHGCVRSRRRSLLLDRNFHEVSKIELISVSPAIRVTAQLDSARVPPSFRDSDRARVRPRLCGIGLAPQALTRYGWHRCQPGRPRRRCAYVARRRGLPVYSRASRS